MSHLPYCQVGAGSSAGLGAGGLDFPPPVPPLALLGVPRSMEPGSQSEHPK